MKIACVWEHNGQDTLLYARDFPGAYARGENLQTAVSKLPNEIKSYRKWCGIAGALSEEVDIVQNISTELNVRDADSDVLLVGEETPLSWDEYQNLKYLALKSAEDFQMLYDSIPNQKIPLIAPRKTFYGQIPVTAEEMYQHTKSVNAYYFGEIGVDADNGGSILECRERGFAQLEKQEGFLSSAAQEGSYGEYWSLRKMLRRFIWHDRIHARAMWRGACRLFGGDGIRNPFYFT